jgi:hypothetical protein
MSVILEILKESAVDTLKVIPFLYAVYLLIEYTEHHHSDKLSAALEKMGAFGSLGGAILGSVPQCGFSAAASNLYSGGMISTGTLISVFIATSDEAVPIMISNPSSAKSLWKLLIVKIIIAFIAGFAVDLIIKLCGRRRSGSPHYDEICRECDCEHHSVAYSAFIHTLQISLFIFAISFVLGAAFEFAGSETIAKIMMRDSPFQPFIAALFGFIPNCAASVVITELYTDGVLSFGSCIAGLSTGAGVGLLVLFRANRHAKQNLGIMGIMYLTAVISGLIINLFM